jgi:hypothetical protein
MKNNRLIIATLLLFLLLNTTYFWEGYAGVLLLPVALLMFIVFCFLVIAFLYHLGKGIRYRYTDKAWLMRLGVMAILLVLIILKPTGLINFHRYEGKTLFMAQREGVANCMTTFKIKPKQKFKFHSVCFSVTNVNGTYSVHNDTLFFDAADIQRVAEPFYQYAVIGESTFIPGREAIFLYRDHNDIHPLELWIIENDIFQ